MKKIKKYIAYIICLLIPKSIIDLVNEAEDAAELDAKVKEGSGLFL